MNGGGLFNQTGTSNSGNTFGQPQNPSQTSSFGGFGSSSSSAQGGLFGQQKTGGMFGSNTATQPSQTAPFASSSSAPITPTLFGSNPSSTSTQPPFLFGNKPTTSGSSLLGSSSTNQPSGSLFGSKPASTGTSLFGTTTATTPATSTTGTGLFGNKAAQTTSAGTGLFGTSTATTNSVGTTPMFGKPISAGTSTGTGSFGSSVPASGSGTLGTTFAPTTTATGSLFGKAATPIAGGAAPTTGVSIFGSKTQTAPANGLGGSATATTSTSVQPVAGLFGATSNGAAGRLFATIEQPSFTLPGPQTNGSPKLYKSLTANVAQPVKDNSRPAPPVKLTVASVPQVFNTKNSSLPAKRPLEHQQDTRKLLNSYEKYIKERPTNLIIRRAKRPALAISSPTPKLTNENWAAKAITEKPVNGPIEASISQSLADSTIPSADVSLFHKQAQAVTLVRVNKAALEQGYFIRPGLDELASYSKQQLKEVPNLVIGRDNFGQLSYSDPVDLSGVENLGDILGKLVVFDEGTVCVYPDDGRKVEPGKELNVPCTVTIENAFPRDTQGKLILSMADPRMAKHVSKLRKANESRGAEFITFSHGVWVFKVPHFSTWGMPVDEMVVDDDLEDETSVNEHDGVSIEVNGISRLTEGAPTKVESVPPLARSNPIRPVDSQKENASASIFPRTSTPEFVSDEMRIVMSSQPSKSRTWIDVLANSYLLKASKGAVASASAVDGSVTTNDLNRILYASQDGKFSPYEELRRPQTVFISHSMLKRASTVSGVKKMVIKNATTTLDATILKPFVTKVERSPAANGLPRLTTDISFGDLQALSPHPLWPICSVIFDGDSKVTRRERLSSWLVDQTSKAVSKDLSAAEDDFGAIWALISGHRLEDAAVRAVASGNPHLATLISQLGSSAVRSAAEAQLKEWKSTGAIFYVPPKVRAIYELASGNVGLIPAYSANGQRVPELDLTQGFDWKRVLGLKLWYGMPDVEIENIIATLPVSTDCEFVFLRLVCQPSVLNRIDNLVGLPTAFLALQALRNIPRESRTIDNVCVQLSYGLLDSSQLTTAIFVALHIMDDKLALTVVKDILMRSPWSLSSSSGHELDVPDQLVMESKALYAHYAQNYVKEAELLINAELFDDAHKVLITQVAPQAIICNDFDATAQLLQLIPATVKGWKLGGKVYLDYFKFINKPTSELSLSLCSALQTISTSNIEHRAAVAIMASQVASQGRNSLMTPQILKMKLDSSQYRLQAMQQAAVDLIQM